MIAVADALLPLLGAVIGGLLVLLGDGIRRRQERRREDERRLFEAAVAVSVAYNRTFGELVAARNRRDPPEVAEVSSLDRYEATTRFWATPGSGAMSLEASALARAHRALRDSYQDQAEWDVARDGYNRALRSLEAAVRRRMGDEDPLPG